MHCDFPPSHPASSSAGLTRACYGPESVHSRHKQWCRRLQNRPTDSASSLERVFAWFGVSGESSFSAAVVGTSAGNVTEAKQRRTRDQHSSVRASAAAEQRSSLFLFLLLATKVRCSTSRALCAVGRTRWGHRSRSRELLERQPQALGSASWKSRCVCEAHFDEYIK